MTTQPPLIALNLFVKDMAAALAFYRMLGVPIPAGAEKWPHVSALMPNGLSLEFDTFELTKSFDTAWQMPSGGARNSFQFLLASRPAVDELFARLTAAGYHGHLCPFDAFWGARYAVVDDPDGNLVALTSEQDPAHKQPIPIAWPAE